MLVNATEKLLTQDTANWLKTAHPDDISAALNMGYASWRNMPATRPSSHPSVQSNTHTGTIGESYVMDILKTKYSDVQNVSKEPHQGDLRLSCEHNRIMIEVKNYSNPVPTIEVDKFKRDLSTYHGGVFISLRTSIAGMRSSNEFIMRSEYVDGRVIPCAYIASDHADVILTAVSAVSQMIALCKHVCARSTDDLQSHIQGFVNNLNMMTRIRCTLSNDITDIINKLTKASSHMLTCEGNMRAQVDDMNQSQAHMRSADLMEICGELEKNRIFARYPRETQTRILTLIELVHRRVYLNEQIGGIWNMSARGCTCNNGVGFEFSVHVLMVIPHMYGLSVHDLIGCGKIHLAIDGNESKVRVDDYSYGLLYQMFDNKSSADNVCTDASRV